MEMISAEKKAREELMRQEAERKEMERMEREVKRIIAEKRQVERW